MLPFDRQVCSDQLPRRYGTGPTNRARLRTAPTARPRHRRRTARVLFIAVSGYVTLLILLRVAGQRTLAQMSGLDLVITVTIGSAFGRVLTAREVALSEVVAAFVSLILLQWLVANLWGRTTTIRRYVATSPTLLYDDGEIIERGMRRHHLVTDDLHAAARQHGMGSLDEARAILLEGNGSLSVLSRNQYGDGAALGGLDTGTEAET